MPKKVDHNHKSICDGLRQTGCSVLSLAPMGHGVPDVLVFHPRTGLALFEIKNPDMPPSKQRLTPDEAKFHQLWRGKIHIITSLDDALRVVGLPEK